MSTSDKSKPEAPRAWLLPAALGAVGGGLLVALVLGLGGRDSAPASSASASAAASASGWQLVAAPAPGSAELVAAAETKCAAGDQPQCFLLARYLELGQGIATDWARAQSLYEKSCEAGAGAACARMSEAYRKGDNGLVADLGVAQQWAQKGCKLQNGAACTALAFARMRPDAPDNDFLAIVADFEQGCGLGDEMGCVSAGRTMVQGHGVPKDATRGVALMEKACDAGGGYACRILAQILQAGAGPELPPDPERAKRYIDKGCQLGDEVACNLQKQP